jgi:hypothetical protein
LLTLFQDSEAYVFAHLVFGNFYNAGNITEVTISRAGGDYFWVGSVISSYNQ